MILKWPCCWSVVAREYAMLLRVRPVPPISRHPKLGPSRVLSGLFRSPARRRLTLRSSHSFAAVAASLEFARRGWSITTL
jgi:hypothetical protein